MTRAANSRSGHAERGVTIVELMVSLVVVSIAVGFTFRIYAVSSGAYRSQTRLAELQQTLRSSRDRLVRDLRMAGELATSIKTAVTGNPDFILEPMSIVNNADGTGPDSFRVVYADLSCLAQILDEPGPAFPSAESLVDGVACFVDGDIALAVRTSQPRSGEGCIMKITNVQAGSNHLQHAPGGPGAPWNDVQNSQCDDIGAECTNAAGEPCWKDGHTMFTKFIARAYRLRPNDARGVLEVSESGGFAGATDWQPLAFGIVDMQVAVYVYEPDAAAVDTDGDGDAHRNWRSGENMEDPNLTKNGNELLQARLSLVGRTTWPVDGVMTQATPDLMGDPVAANSIGDRDSITLIDANGQPTITDKTSRLYGNHLFRSTTSMVDFRNMGVGK